MTATTVARKTGATRTNTCPSSRQESTRSGMHEGQDENARHDFREAEPEGVGQGAGREHDVFDQHRARKAGEQQQSQGNGEHEEHEAAGHPLPAGAPCVNPPDRAEHRDPERRQVVERAGNVARDDGQSQRRQRQAAVDPQPQHRDQQQAER